MKWSAVRQETRGHVMAVRRRIRDIGASFISAMSAMNRTRSILLLAALLTGPLLAQRDDGVHVFVDGGIGLYHSLLFGESGVPKGGGGGIRFAGDLMVSVRTSTYARFSDRALEVQTGFSTAVIAQDGEEIDRRRFFMVSLHYTIREYDPLLINIGGGFISTTYSSVRSSAMYDYRETESATRLTGAFVGGELEWVIGRSPISLFCDVRGSIVSGPVEYTNSRYDSAYDRDEPTLGIHLAAGMRVTL